MYHPMSPPPLETEKEKMKKSKVEKYSKVKVFSCWEGSNVISVFPCLCPQSLLPHLEESYWGWDFCDGEETAQRPADQTTDEDFNLENHTGRITDHHLHILYQSWYIQASHEALSKCDVYPPQTASPYLTVCSVLTGALSSCDSGLQTEAQLKLLHSFQLLLSLK